MKSGDSPDRRHRGFLSRRQFLGGTGAGCLALLSGAWRVAGEENPAPPKFLLEWGRRGKEEGAFSACIGIAIGKDDTVWYGDYGPATGWRPSAFSNRSK